MIEREGIDIYRQDFNHPPKPFWEDNEQPDRIGMTEIRHIEGLYTYWDYLLSRFPRLLIDNCAAGGRRIDLETLSRSAPLWRTDYPYGEVTGYQSHTYGLNFFLPQHGTGMWETDDYSTRSSLGAAVVATWDLSTHKLKVADHMRAIANFKKYRPYYYEDYYPLTGIIDTQSDQYLARLPDAPSFGQLGHRDRIPPARSGFRPHYGTAFGHRPGCGLRRLQRQYRTDTAHGRPPTARRADAANSAETGFAAAALHRDHTRNSAIKARRPNPATVRY